jgi:hypothetical protein
MVESDIVLLYILVRVWGIINAVGPGVTSIQTPVEGLFPVTYDSGRS